MTGAQERSVAKAIDALRRGWPVRIAGTQGSVTVVAIENADAAALAEHDPSSKADILLSPGRAATLKLINQINAADPQIPVIITRTSWIDLAAATALADPALDLATPMKGPFRTHGGSAPDAASAAIELARLARLLPAFFLCDDAEPQAFVEARLVHGHDESATLKIAARAKLPVDICDTAEIVAFRSSEDSAEHVALLLGRPNGNLPLVRLHSECLTGDVLGSLKCDCGPQLDLGLRLIAESGWGILLYLRQEGRGIGLVNKLRAYSLQDQGFDTVDANVRLGFAIDARDFRVAAKMLHLLGQDAVRLLTNNPGKVDGLDAVGVRVVERVAHAIPSNPHNHDYLAAKRDRTGHVL